MSDSLRQPQRCTRKTENESPKLDRVIYSFGQIWPTKRWLAQAAARFPGLDRRAATARAMIEDIEALAPADRFQVPS